MAAILIDYSGYPYKYARCDYQVDSETDLASIPETVRPGSTARTGDLSKIWNKANDGTWKQI